MCGAVVEHLKLLPCVPVLPIQPVAEQILSQKLEEVGHPSQLVITFSICPILNWYIDFNLVQPYELFIYGPFGLVHIEQFGVLWRSPTS